MNSEIFPQIQAGWEKLIDQVVDDAEPAIVCSPSGKKVVIVPLDEFDSWQETRYLASLANASHLRKSFAEAASSDNPKEIKRWSTEMSALREKISEEDHATFMAALEEQKRVGKEMMRREMGLE
jgi:antitoxin YefM